MTDRNVKWVLRHRWLGYYLSGYASEGSFAHSPNPSDAVTFTSFEAAEWERRQLREFAAAWMAITVEISVPAPIPEQGRRREQTRYAEQVVSFVFGVALLACVVWGVVYLRHR